MAGAHGAFDRLRSHGSFRSFHHSGGPFRAFPAGFGPGSRQGSLWGDVDTSPRSHIVKNVGQRRRMIVGYCYQLQVDVDHYNEYHPAEEPLQTVMNFEDDIAEMMMAAGIKK